MDLIPLGRSGLTTTRLGLGLAALGRPGYINLGHASDTHAGRDVAAMEARAHEVLDAAWSAGVRYFDAARSYGRAEEFLAGWLRSRAIPPEAVTVGSKWGYTYTAGWQVEAEAHEVKDHTAPTLARQLAESRALLGPYLRLYQIHSATLESGVLADRSVHESLARLKGEGVSIGLSLSGPRQAETLRRALGVVVAGEPLFDCVQATWNLLEPSAGPALAEAHAAGLGVIVKEGLANGRLTPRNDDPSFAPRRQTLEAVAADLGTTLDALSLAAALARPWAHVVLSGAASAAQLHSNVRALSIRWDPRFDKFLAPLAEDAAAYWSTRSGLPWN